jgi:ketosteroid isomerase-like protein
MSRNVCLCAIALTSMLTFTGCQTAPQPEQKRDVAANIKAINALRDQYAAGFNSSNAAAVAASYTDDAVVMLPNQPAVEGRQAIQTMLEMYFKEQAAKIGHTPLETQVAGD